MDSYLIRELMVSDAERLYTFYQDAEIKEFYRPYGEEVSMHTIVSLPIARVADGKEIGMIICDKENKILGHAFLRQNPNFETEYGFGIGISKKLRGQGLGKKLINELFETGQQRGVERITLSVFSANKKANELYLRNGFKELKRAVGGSGEESIYMVKSFVQDVPVKADIFHGQQLRRQQLYASYRNVARNWFNQNGEWIAPERSLIAEGVGGLREIYWHAMGMLSSSDDNDIQHIMPVLEKEQKYRCSFAPFVALQILKKYPEKLSDNAKNNLIEYITWNLPKSCTIDFQYHGYNDNMPAMKSFVLLVAGEMLNEQKWIDQGLASLCQLRSLFMRRGWLNEFNSPTYTSIILMALSEIANYARNEDAIELAKAAGERIFADIAFHWHKETSGPSGAFSRAYTMDSVGHCSYSNTLIWLLLGDEVFINPLRYYFGNESDKVVLHHKSHLPFLQVSSAWQVSTDYLVYPDIIDYLRTSEYPRIVKGTAESGSASPGKTELNKVDGSYKFIRAGNFSHPFMNYSSILFMQKKWAMGTATGYMSDGVQSDLFFLRYALNNAPSGVEDIRTIYARFLINDSSNYVDYEENGKKYRVMNDLVRNQGAGFAFQHESTAMMCCKPIPFAVTEPISSLRLRIFLYAKHSEPEKVEFENNNIVIEDHGVHILFKPMVNNSGIEKNQNSGKVEISRDGDWICIDIFNYEGSAREFTEEEIQDFCNGFVCEISEDPFDQNILDALPTDNYYFEQRRIFYKRNKVELETVYDPLSMGIRCRSVNGRPFSEPMLDVNNYGVNKLPWVNSSYPEIPVDFNWREIIETREMPY